MKHSTATLSPTHHDSAWYDSAMERLVGVVQELSRTRSVDEVTAIVRRAARELTGADGATFVLREGDQCHYAEENAISPLWKGHRFPMESCISGWSMLNAEPVVIEDIYRDARIPHDAYRPTFVKSLLMVPIRRDTPIGAIGNYWATQRRPSEQEIAILQALADTTSVALENAQLYSSLQATIDTLQKREKRIQQQHEALEVFTRALAHDLREPLRTINAFSALVAEEPLSGRAGGFFRHIHKAGRRMMMLVDTVFEYIQLDDPAEIAKESCKMDQVLREVRENIEQLIRDKGARVTSDPLPTLYANRAQLIQLLQNLLVNALRHNANGVEVHVGVERRGKDWQFCVRDNGTGIAGNQLKTIFQPFKRATRHEEGSGLGLAICQKILETYQGKIWCESLPGEGATFFFTFPAMDASIAHADSVAQQNKQPHAPLANVLLVDDREADLDLTRITLQEKMRIQCNLFSAQTGKEALELMHRKREENTPIDLTLLDINMPEMDGFEVLQEIQRDARLKDTAVLMCSGSSYDKDRRKADSLGAAGYVVKPMKFDILAAMLRRLPDFELFEDEDGYIIQRIQ